MERQLEQLIRDNGQDCVMDNDQVPNEKNEQVINAASSSITDVLKEKSSSGGTTDLINSFTSGNGDGGNMVEQVKNTFASKLSGLGINAETAKSIGAALIPLIMSKFFNKAADPNDSSFNLQEIIGKFAGGADGKFDMNDVKDMFNGGDKGASSDDKGDGGIVDKLKGLS